MSIWRKLLGGVMITEHDNREFVNESSLDKNRYAIVDVEVGLKDHQIHDIGALRCDGAVFHKTSKKELFDFLRGIEYLCGHNIIHHDVKYLFTDGNCPYTLVDTLYLSPLLFPERPYHHLVKDDKLVSDQINNPVNDCKNAEDLLHDEITKWNLLTDEKRLLIASLLKDKKEFDGFLKLVNARYIQDGLNELIRTLYSGIICNNAEIEYLVRQYPCGLAYALAMIDTEYHSLTPAWVLYNYPEVEYIIKLLRQTKCIAGCEYCNTQLDVKHNLKIYFGYDSFRTYAGEPLQEQAATAAVEANQNCIPNLQLRQNSLPSLFT